MTSSAHPRRAVPRTLRDWVVDLTCFVAIGGVCALNATPAVLLAATVAVFTVAVHRRAQLALLLAMFDIVAFTIDEFLFRTNTEFRWVRELVNLVIVLFAVAWGMFVRARRQLVESLHTRALRATQEQRQRIAQARHLERTRIWVLRNDDPDEDLTEPTETPTESAAGAKIRYSCTMATADGDGDDRETPIVPPSVARTVYRIVQEGLTNASKHAPNTLVDITIGPTDHKTFAVAVTNPLPPHPGGKPKPGLESGLGLVSLAERVQLAGGNLTSTSTGSQFTLRAELPWRR